MKASAIIKKLEEQIKLYGDWNVIIRIDDEDDIDVGSVYTDDESERIVISDFFGF